jgi:hypothetical protein
VFNGATTAAAARASINAAQAGANTDITSLNSPNIGAATATTPSLGDNSTRVATTAFVAAFTPATSALGSGTADSTTFLRGDRTWASPGLLPLTALSFPTIATPTNTISVVSNIVSGQGGTVSVPSGVNLSLGREVDVGSTGILVGFTTQAWTSGNLDTNSTYYLRAQVQNGELVFYVQKGTDTDPIPASLKGTPGGASGGGFDSTVIDMLIAKVVTGAAGTAPTVTSLANAYRLRSHTLAFDNYTRTTSNIGTITAKRATALTLNWARTPTVYQTRTAYLIYGAASNPEELTVVYSGSVSDGSGTQTATFNRYVFDPVFYGDWNTGSTTFSFSFQTDYLVEA